MPESEAYREGREMRRKLLGDAYVERVNKNTYGDSMMTQFIDLAQESVFRHHLDPPGAGSQDADAGHRGLRRRHRPRAGAGHSPADGPAPRLDGRPSSPR